MRVGMAQGGQFFPVLLCLYANDMPSLSHYFELAFYADDTDITATYRKSTLLVSYLEAYISDLERWLRERRIGIFEEHHDELREGRTAYPLAPTNTAVRVAILMGRHIALTGAGPGYTANLVASYR